MEPSEFMKAKMVEAVLAAFESFKSHLEDNFEAQVTNESRLLSLFPNQLQVIVETGLDENASGGNFIDELYGDDVMDCVRYTAAEE
jgi:hypothetical protein